VSTNSTKSLDSITSAILKQPLIWGGLASALFYAAVRSGQIQHPLITRYFASHPVEYIATTMFCVGIAALVFKYLQVVGQSKTGREPLLGPPTDRPDNAEAATGLLHTLDQHRRSVQTSLLGKRLRGILEYIQRKGSADDYEEQLHHLADTAEAESHRSYSLVRIITSTIPLLGFLGTVIGLTKAVAELVVQVGEVGLEAAINPVISGLSVAFDTTALALALSIVLIFAMHFVNRREAKLLADVERQAEDELLGRFLSDPAHDNPQVLALRRMCEQVVQATEQLVGRQSELWEATIDAAHQRWSTLSVTTERQLETSLSRALQSSYEAHSKQLEERAAAENSQNNEQWASAVAALEQSTEQMRSQQLELQQQGNVMLQAVDATGRVLKLEEALNKNLGTLAESHNFEQTVMSLAAAINLFSTKLGASPNVSREMEPGQAA